jgi:predicted RNA-binding protein with PIN domain
MTYIIDGHNLIPKISGLSLKDIDDEIALIKILVAFCQRKGKRCEVYFDNAPPGQIRDRKFGSVKAHFVSRNLTADKAILNRLHSLGKSARNYTVVSSDRQVQAGARAAHAAVYPSEDFANLIIEEPRGSLPDLGADPEVSLSENEVSQWLRLFNKKEDGNKTSKP